MHWFCKGCPEAMGPGTDCEGGVFCCLRAITENDPGSHEMKMRQCKVCGQHFCWNCASEVKMVAKLDIAYMRCPQCETKYDLGRSRRGIR